MEVPWRVVLAVCVFAALTSAQTCRNPPLATFDDGFSYYTNAKTGDQEDWIRSRSATTSVGTGPTTDHTTGTTAGHYLYLEATGASSGDKAILLSTTYNNTKSCQMSFWYHMYGSQIGTLQVMYKELSATATTQLFTKTGDQGNKWIRGVVTLPATSKLFQIQFVATRGSGFRSDIAIDDVAFASACCMTYVIPKSTQCDASKVATFETGTNGWVQEFSDQFDWRRDAAGTGSLHTGPATDHTYGNNSGYYMYIETSGQSSGDKAILRSPQYPVPDTLCKFSFWYHMYGSTIGTLEVQIKIGSTTRSLWKTSGDQGDVWRNAKVPLGTVSGPFTLSIIGSKGTSFTGDIAIDDLGWDAISCNCVHCSVPANTAWTSGWQGYTQFTGDDFDWTRRQGSTPSFGTGPTRDHTTGSSSGWYVYIETSLPRNRGHAAAIISPSYTPTKGGCSMSFWYHMYGATTGTLNVFIRVGVRRVRLWTLSGNQGNSWKNAVVPFFADGAYQMEFQGITGTSFTGDIALDDITFNTSCCQVTNNPVTTAPSTTASPCVQPTLATFDSSTNGFTNYQFDNFDWVRQIGQVGSTSSGPTQDHTSESTSVSGYYWFINTRASGSGGQRAVLISPFYPKPTKPCQASFWYHMYGSSTGGLAVTVASAGTYVQVFSMTGNKGNRWIQANITIPASTPGDYQLQFAATRQGGTLGDIAIDDVMYYPSCCGLSPPPTTTKPPVPVWHPCTAGVTTFDNGWQNYTQLTNGTLLYTRRTGGTPSSGTGPPGDHTSGSGYYLYIEVSSGRRGTATLLSPWYVAVNSLCTVSFWYHMQGTATGTLNVYEEAPGITYSLFSKRGSQGASWIQASATLSTPLNSRFRLVFQATHLSSGFTGDIALDDIAFDNKKCCEVCSFQRAAVNFDSGLQGFVQDRTDNFDWTRDNAGTPSFNTGPTNDHTLGTAAGYYMYTETSGRPVNQVARLISPRYGPPDQAGCAVTFWYNMFGAAMGTLRVKAVPVLTNFSVTEQVLWTLSGNQGAGWKKATTKPITMYTAYNLVIEGVVGTSFTSDMAIDDISMPKTCCKVSVITCSSTEWRCANLVNCIPLTSRCDLKNDCPDNSDEVNCTCASGVAGIAPFDFETGNMGFLQLNSSFDNFDWTRTRGSTTSGSTGPTTDHTLKSTLGYYYYIETSSPRSNGDNAIMVSPWILPISPVGARPCTMDIWLHMYGATINQFNMYIQVPGGALNATSLLSMSGNQGNLWFKRTVTIPATIKTNFRIVLQGTRGGSFTGDIAIDDITFSWTCCSKGVVPPPPSPTPTPISMCPPKTSTFTTNLDGYTQSTADDFNWIRRRGGTTSGSTGPTNDHTTGTGFYMYIETSAPRSLGDKAVLISPSYLRTSTPVCSLSFWYHMYGTTIGTLNVYQVSGAVTVTTTKLWTKTGGQGNRWIRATINLKPVINDNAFYLTFEAIRGTSFTGDIAIDDVSFDKDCCVVCSSPANITFEKNLGGLTQSTTDKFDWTIWNGGTSSGSTGPAIDHTLGTGLGIYAYIETSSPRVAGDTAILTSGLFDTAKAGGCPVTFWYHMFGASIGSLTISTIDSKGATAQVWMLAGNQGNVWRQGNFTIPTSLGQFKLEFKGTRGTSFTGDIAIDDIFFAPGCSCYGPVCSPSQFTCPSVCINNTAVCDLHEDCSDASDESSAICPACPQGVNFENGPDYMYQSTTDQLDWVPDRAGTPSGSTGPPPSDHTLGSRAGTYYYVESSSPVTAGQFAVMSTPFFNPPTGLGCNVRFAYSMYGATIGSMTVTAVDKANKATQLWTLSGNQGQGWKFAQVAISLTTTFRLDFRATRGTSFTGDIAIDDISYTSACGCLANVTCTSTQFACKYNCIDKKRRCDYNVDCLGDNSDEQNCDTQCPYGRNGQSFENGMYPFVVASNGDIPWNIRRGSTPSGSTGPTNDHTLGTTQGTYLYIEASSPTSTGDKAILQSQYYYAKPKGPSCYLRFWYNMYGGTIGTLIVNIMNSRTRANITAWTKSGNQGQGWKLGEIPLPQGTYNYDFQVMFVAIRGTGFAGDIAIDDISFTDDCGCATALPPYSNTDASCNFDVGLCNYVNPWRATTALRPWFRRTTGTPSGFTGPTADHTPGAGRGYIHVEASGTLAGQQAIIATPDMSAGTYCFGFWYNMYGENIGHLRAQLRYSNGTVMQTLYHTSGNQGNVWYNAASQTITVSDQFNIAFEYTFAGGYAGDAAIDDVIASLGKCPTVPPPACPFGGHQCATTKACIPAPRVCDFIQDCPSGSDELGCTSNCTFDTNQCNWQNGVQDVFDWTRRRGRTPSGGTGPSSDHTTGTGAGYYMYTEASGLFYLHTATLVSKTIGRTGQFCQVNFWYHMYSTTAASGAVLNMYVKTPNGRSKNLFHLVGNQGNAWKQGTANIGPRYLSEVVFEGKRGVSFNSDIAIDDITFVNCVPGAAKTCLVSEFTCLSQLDCVPLSKRCDGELDCSDHSDEVGCPDVYGSCDFEQGGTLCNFTNPASAVGLQFTRSTFITSTVNTGPHNDHTYGNNTGHFMYIETSNGFPVGSVAQLIGPTLDKPVSNCSVSFWYNMFGPTIGNLTLFRNDANGKVQLWRASGNKGQTWLRAVAIVGTTIPYNLIFEATKGGFQGDIAVDDILMTSGCSDQLTPTQCYAHQFTCSNKRCVWSVYRCDGVNDCGDNSDEANCPVPPTVTPAPAPPGSYLDYRENCTFDQNTFCTWTNSITDSTPNNDWTLKTGSTASSFTGPKSGHGGSGSYIYVETSDLLGGTVTDLFSKTVYYSGPQCTFNFWYHMYGQDCGDLNIMVRYRDTGAESRIWRESGPHADQWLSGSASIPIVTNSSFVIVVRHVHSQSGGFRGDVAIDDFSFVNCNPSLPAPRCPTTMFQCPDGSCVDPLRVCDYTLDCPSGLDEVESQCSRIDGRCDFENSLCGYVQLQTDDIDWNVGRGLAAISPTAPQVDHTTMAATGHYLFIQADRTHNTGDVASIATPLMAPPYAACYASFCYHMYGSELGTLNVSVGTGTETKTAWSRTGDQGDQWLCDKVRLNSFVTSDFRLVISANRGSGIKDEIAIDDISFSQGCSGFAVTPAPTTTPVYKADCNFDKGYCAWTNSYFNQLDWDLQKGPSPSSNTGPGMDHTSGSGQYIYLETSLGSVGQYAILQSPVLTPSTTGCSLNFWYHMFGATVGSLDVGTLSSSPGSSPVSLFQLVGSQGNFWKSGMVTLPSTGPAFSVLVRGTRGVSYTGDIALDDFTFGTCPTAPPSACSGFQCSSGKCLDSRQVCDFIKDCSDGADELQCPTSCSFEIDDCYWRNTQKGDSFYWARHSATRPYSGQVAPVDHTRKTAAGFYMFARLDAGASGYQAILQSPKFSRTSSLCTFNFWYYMSGLSVGNLVLEMRSDNRPIQVLWRKIGTQGASWQQGSQLIGEQFQVQMFFMASRPLSVQGVIAIDDVSFTSCTPRPLATCSPTQFQCFSGKCIASTSACDMRRDCADGTDEGYQSCSFISGNCNFETGLCGYKNGSAQVGNFKRTQAIQGSLNRGPRIDSTFQNTTGYYMMLGLRGASNGEVVALVTPSQLATVPTSACTVRFYYYLAGGTTGNVRMVLQSASGRSALWTTSTQSSSWTRVVQPISSTGPFNISFEAVRNTFFSGVFAIDDVSYDPACFNAKPTAAACPVWQKACADGQCILDSWFCDGDTDCRDGSDEKGCPVPTTQSPPTFPPGPYPAGVCTYQTGFCGWKQVQSDTADFQRRRGSTPSVSTGPSRDHTTGSTTGFYAHVEASGLAAFGTLQMVSPTFNAAGYQCTFTMAYHMWGASIGTLEVYYASIVPGSTPIKMFSVSGNQGNQWNQFNGTLQSSLLQPFVFMINVTHGTGFQGDISLDDVGFINCNPALGIVKPPCNKTEFECANKNCISVYKLCDFNNDCQDNSDEDAKTCAAQPGYCNFENSPCGYSNVNWDVFDWVGYRGPTPSVGTGPGVDHTYGNSSGRYIYLETSFPRSPNDKAVFESPYFQPPYGACNFRFWYHMFGATVDQLHVELVDMKNVSSKISSFKAAVSTQWQLATIPIHAITPFKVRFIGTVGTSFTGDIALDDVSFSYGCSSSIATTPAPSPPIFNADCDFEAAGYCGYTSEFIGDMTWIRNAGGTLSPGTGPTLDHTYNNVTGHYIHIEASVPAALGHDARLISPLITPDPARNSRLSFWYHMYGFDIDCLSTIILYADGSSAILWKLCFDQGRQWHNTVIDLPNNGQQFYIRFIATRGNGFTGDISLDDIQFLGPAPTTPPPKCPVGQWYCFKSKICIDSRQVCDFNVDCGSSSEDEDACSKPCDFESGQCNWKNAIFRDLVWARHFGFTATAGTGPSVDHTKGTRQGFYMYANAVGQFYGAFANYQSTLFQRTGAGCRMTFWYHMFGALQGQLSITLWSGRSKEVVWSTHDNKGDVWRPGTATIGARNNFSIVFEAMIGPGLTSDIAIDDVNFTNCGAAKPILPCTSSQFTCQNRNCVPLAAKCDDSNDCGDSSDEQGCPYFIGNCNFENGTCIWKNVVGDSFNWTYQQGFTPSGLTGPNYDHTLGNRSGHYVYIETSAPRVVGDYAELVSDYYYPASTDGSCHLRFFYHMFGDHVANITLYAESNTSPLVRQQLWTMTGNQDNIWHRADVTVRSTTAYRYVFYGLRGASFLGDIALDDITLTAGCIKGTVSCPPGQLPCLSGSHCYAASAKCDGTAQCQDGTDETNCPTVPMTGTTMAPFTGPTTQPAACPADCDFESGKCKFEDDHTVPMSFTLDNGGTPSFNTGPAADHTFKNSTGHYIYIETSGATAGNKARVITNYFFPQSTPLTTTFWYHMNGATIGTLRVVVQDINSTTWRSVWSKTGNQGNSWIQAAGIVVNSAKMFRVGFEASAGTSFTGDIALDDITFTKGCGFVPKPTGPPPPAGTTVGDCDFETENCCWTNTRVGDTFDWECGRDSTVSQGTGPNGDYPTGKGHFMYIEASTSNFFAQADLVGPFLNGPARRGQCSFTMWYHMHGTSVGTLQIQTILQGSPPFFFVPGLRVLWTRSGEQGNQWLNATVDLYGTHYGGTPFQVIVQAQRGGTFSSDIAVDHFVFSSGCGSLFLKKNLCASNPICRSINYNHTGFTPPPYSKDLTGTCNFDGGNCYWTVSAYGDVPWIFHEGSTGSFGTGPSKDSSGNPFGHYYYLEASLAQTGQWALLEGPHVLASPTGACTMTLMYHMFGTQIGTLSINIYSKINGFKTVWSLSGNQGDKWIKTPTIQLSSTTAFRVHIIGTRGNGFTGDIAVDDIQFSKTCLYANISSSAYGANALSDGCSDRSREGLFDSTHIAGCGGTWSGRKNLRAPPTVPIAVCGNKYGGTTNRICQQPADLCEPGWHICGSLKTGIDEIRDSMVGSQCSTAGYGRFSAGVNHCHLSKACTSAVRGLDYGCGVFGSPCSEPLCCGAGCNGYDNCNSAIFPNNQTSYYKGVSPTAGCGYINAQEAGGVMCCKMNITVVTPAPPPAHSTCDFEKNFCTWTNLAGSDFDWIRRFGSTTSFNTGPSYDHTTGTSTGYYIYIETSFPAQVGHQAVLRSQTLNSSTCYIAFWYHMFGATIGELRIVVQDSVKLTTVWSKKGNQGDWWRQAIVPVNSTEKTFSILVFGISGTSFTGDIALDDVALLTCGAITKKTGNTMDCDFEPNLCLWQHVPQNTLYWRLRRGRTPSGGTGPGSDHTFGNSTGHYVYIETSAPFATGDKGQMTSLTMAASGPGCMLSFWYHMLGSGIGSLNVYMNNAKGQQLLWTKSSSQGTAWRNATVALNSASNYTVVFEGVRGSTWQGDISLDDIKFIGNCPLPGPSLPPPPPPQLYSGNCNFESCSCCWYNNIWDNLDFYRGQGATATQSTGPQFDHTLANAFGSYMYLEASSRVAGGNARYISKGMYQIPSPGVCTLTVFYHMQGSCIGQFAIIGDRFPPPNNPARKIIWSVTGDQGPYWNNVTVDLYNNVGGVGNFTVTLRASLNTNCPFGDIAFDDLTFSPGCSQYFINNQSCHASDVCAAPHNHSQAGTQPPAGVVVANCNFESRCDWQASAASDQQFRLWEGFTPSGTTGPTFDHTTATPFGHYMYFEASGTPVDTRAILESPQIAGGTACTFTMWYHMYGSTTGLGTLYVYQYTPSASSLTQIWSKSGNQGDKWNSVQLSLTGGSFRIHIVVVHANSWRGDIAVDDFMFSSGCGAFTKNPTTAYGYSALTTGCADRTREGFFTDTNVAACTGRFARRMDMRTPPSALGARCGNNYRNNLQCYSPADVCDTINGWYPCGARGARDIITNVATGARCAGAGYGTFVTAINHCAQQGGCKTANISADYGCTELVNSCDYPLCCGTTCTGKDSCDSGFWPKMSFYPTGFTGSSDGCRSTPPGIIDGVMCCRDASYVPPVTPGTKYDECTFENGWCGWTSSTTSSSANTIPWLRDRLGTPTGNTGPTTDHTKGNGFYVYAEVSGAKNERARAILTSKLYPALSTHCAMEFYYHMFGQSIGSLQVFVVVGSTATQLWQLSGNQGDVWRKATLRIPAATSYQIKFVVERGQTFSGDIALDDISFHSCRGVSVCQANEFQCATSGNCLPTSQQCDGVPQCSDASDESSCGNRCHYLFCVNGGTCSVPAGANATCACPPGYSGMRCEKTIFSSLPTTAGVPGTGPTLGPETSGQTPQQTPVNTQETQFPPTTNENVQTTTAKEAPGNNAAQSTSHGLSTGATVAVVIGVCVMIAIAIVMLLLYRRSLKKQPPPSGSSNDDTVLAVGNPVYSMYGGDGGQVNLGIGSNYDDGLDDVSMSSDMFDARRGQPAPSQSNPLYQDPYKMQGADGGTDDKVGLIN